MNTEERIRKLGTSVVYQIYPKSFQDSNDDGIGDLQGIIRRLDYLKELGVDMLWLTPVFASPGRDNGYDISDYYRIDPVFGSMEDMEQLIEEAGKLGIGIMLDMVLNHTSTEHVWFQRALSGDAYYQQFYLFRNGKDGGPPTNWQSKFGGSAWCYVPSLGQWYLHLFDEGQADLNWDNPAVRSELAKVVRFWKEKGVRGFRFDVVNLISKPAIWQDDDIGDGRRFYTDGPRVHEYLRELVEQAGIADDMTVGEMSSTSLAQCIRYASLREHERELSMVFHFQHLKVDYPAGDKWALMEPDLEALWELLRHWQEGMAAGEAWDALFWCNHDQPRIVSRLGNEETYWKESAKMLAACIHLLRGTPYIYQGEELGMVNPHFTKIGQYRDVESLNHYRILLEKGVPEQEALDILASRSRDNARTPMPWTHEANGGFTKGLPWLSPGQDWQRSVAADQVEDAGSVYRFYQTLIRLRRQHAVIAQGSVRIVPVSDRRCFCYVRALGRQRVLVVLNASQETISLPDLVPDSYELMLGNYEDGHCFASGVSLRPFEVLVLRTATVPSGRTPPDGAANPVL